MERVRLIGLDFGTTTSSALVASACVRRNAVHGRMELSDLKEHFRSPMVFTPFQDGRLDLRQVEIYLDEWMQGGTDYFGGGALLTGLTAQADNAAELTNLLRSRLGDALIASADDPCLESWLGFMGNCAGLSQAEPHQPFLNLDVGGGTANLALGLAGEVLATGCLFVGARHIQVTPGTYRIVRLSPYAQALLDDLGIAGKPGAELSAADVDKVLDFYLKLLEAAVMGTTLNEEIARMHVQVPLRKPTAVLASPLFTIGGGVGELVYRHVHGQPWPSTTAFGDLGIDLARRLVESPLWAPHWQRVQPAAGSRATVFGLLRHSTHVSGSTVFLRHPEDLPLRDVPILGTIADTSNEDHIAELIRLACGSPGGAALRLDIRQTGADAIRNFARRLADALQGYPSQQPLVLFVGPNVGKVLGQYITAWGASPLHVMVIDEIHCGRAHHAHIGPMRDQVIPVSFFGLRE